MKEIGRLLHLDLFSIADSEAVNLRCERNVILFTYAMQSRIESFYISGVVCKYIWEDCNGIFLWT